MKKDVESLLKTSNDFSLQQMAPLKLLMEIYLDTNAPNNGPASHREQHQWPTFSHTGNISISIY